MLKYIKCGDNYIAKNHKSNQSKTSLYLQLNLLINNKVIGTIFLFLAIFYYFSYSKKLNFLSNTDI